MSWSTGFLSYLSNRSLRPMFLLEYIEAYEEPGRPFSIGSHAGAGTPTRIGVNSVQIQGQTLNPFNWSSTNGAFSVGIVGDLTILGYWTKGTAVQLKVGFPGMVAGDFQPVALGIIRNIRRTSENSWMIDCYDMVTALTQRLKATSGNYALFALVGTATTLSIPYLTGAAAVVVSSTTGFETETGGTGVIKVTPDTGDAFYLTYTGTSGGTTFTGVSATGQFGTTAGAAAAGNAVVESAYLTGHPLDFLRKILVSRGSGANGSYDTLPSGWGLGLNNALIDHDEIDRWKNEAVKVASGSYSLDIVVDAQVDNALSWMQGYMAKLGLFFVLRQGLLSIAAGQPTHGTALRPPALEITDADIVEIESWEAWADSYTNEYGYLYVATGNSSDQGSSTNAATLPFFDRLTYDLSGFVWSNDAAIQDDILNRLTEVGIRVPERLVLRCAPLRLACLTPGDLVYVTTRRQPSRARGSFSGVTALVEEVSADWNNGMVRIGLLIYPLEEDVFP